MAGCSSAKSWWNANPWVHDRSRAYKHIWLMSPSHIFNAELSTSVGDQRQSAIFSGRRNVTGFFGLQNNRCFAILISQPTKWIVKQQVQNNRCFSHSAVTTWHGFVHCRDSKKNRRTAKLSSKSISTESAYSRIDNGAKTDIWIVGLLRYRSLWLRYPYIPI